MLQPSSILCFHYVFIIFVFDLLDCHVCQHLVIRLSAVGHSRLFAMLSCKSISHPDWVNGEEWSFFSRCISPSSCVGKARVWAKASLCQNMSRTWCEVKAALGQKKLALIWSFDDPSFHHVSPQLHHAPLTACLLLVCVRFGEKCMKKCKEFALHSVPDKGAVIRFQTVALLLFFPARLWNRFSVFALG